MTQDRALCPNDRACAVSMRYHWRIRRAHCPSTPGNLPEEWQCTPCALSIESHTCTRAACGMVSATTVQHEPQNRSPAESEQGGTQAWPSLVADGSIWKHHVLRSLQVACGSRDHGQANDHTWQAVTRNPDEPVGAKRAPSARRLPEQE